MAGTCRYLVLNHYSIIVVSIVGGFVYFYSMFIMTYKVGCVKVCECNGNVDFVVF